MGYNTVLMVLNDTVDMGAKDPEIGSRIQRAMLSWHSRHTDPGRLDVYYRTPGGGAGSYARVISQEHADLQRKAEADEMNKDQRSVWGFLQNSIMNAIECPDDPLYRNWLAEDLARYEAASR